MFVYVYGTLKTGFRNNVLLSDCKLIQEATTKPLYRLYDCGPYPCLIKDEKNGKRIRGEIYQIDDVVLKRLDRLEGVPFLYNRFDIELENFDHPTIAYFYQDDVSNFIECDGSWPRRKNA